MRMHDGMVMANRGFQDKMFKLYTGESLKQVCTLLMTIESNMLFTFRPDIKKHEMWTMRERKVS